MWPLSLDKIFPVEITPGYGLYGDYVGGILGTVISAVTLVVVFATWRSTLKTQKVQSVLAIIVEMLKTHDAVAGSGEESFWSRSGVPSTVLREFSGAYEQTRIVAPGDEIWSIADRIDIAYTFAFYGLSGNAMESLAHHGTERIKKVNDAVSDLRYQEGKYKNLFKGHQATLAQYMRNLFNMYTFIARSPISSKEKYEIARIVRTKLSNYEQALLALNIMSHLGAEWERLGLVDTFKPFANVPKHFFGFDQAFKLKERFPAVEFEWEAVANERPKYRTLRLRRLGLTLALYPK